MNPSEIALLLETLKKIMKSEKRTYRSLAQELGISEISVKRIFSNRDCSLSRLSQICELLGTSIIELSEIAKASAENENHFLTDQQERFFARKPALFAIFRRLYRGDPADEVKKTWKLNASTFFQTLQELEKIGLLEVHPGNKFKFKISGRLRWKLNGILFNKLLKKQNNDFLETVYQNLERKDCCFQSFELQLSKATMHAMVEEINDLGKKYRTLSYQEERTLPKKSLVDVRWLFAFLPYSTDWTRYEALSSRK